MRLAEYPNWVPHVTRSILNCRGSQCVCIHCFNLLLTHLNTQSLWFDTQTDFFPNRVYVNNTCVMSWHHRLNSVDSVFGCPVTRAVPGWSVAGCNLLSLAYHSADLRPWALPPFPIPLHPFSPCTLSWDQICLLHPTHNSFFLRILLNIKDTKVGSRQIYLFALPFASGSIDFAGN